MSTNQVSEALIPYDPNSNFNNDSIQAQDDFHPGAWAIIRNAFTNPSPGRTLDQTYTALGKVLETQANRAAYRLGLGPNVVEKKVKAHFGTGDHRVLQLELLRTSTPPKLKRYCAELMKYSLPNESPVTQLRAFRAIVDVVTRFSGLRVLCLTSGHLQGEKSREAISAVWDRTDTAFDRKVTFWQTMAATCLSDMTISAILEQSTISNLSKCEAGRLNVIETLLVEHGCSGDSAFASALCVRYLTAILELPDFWLDMGPVHSDVNKKLCFEMINILKDIGANDLILGSLPEDSNPLLDYEGADLLATTILHGLSGWVARIKKDEWPVQAWYQPLRELLRLLRMPQSEELLPTAAACAGSAFEDFVHVYFQKAELTVYVANSGGASHVEKDWNHPNVSVTCLHNDVAPKVAEDATTTPSRSRSSSIHPPASSGESSSAFAGANGQPETDEGEKEDVDVFDGRRSVFIGDEDEETEDEDERDIPKDLDVSLGPEGEGEQETPTGGVDRESAEATVEAALEGEVDDGEANMPEPETRPVVAVQPELPGRPTKVEDADAITENPPTPTGAQETTSVQELVHKVQQPEPELRRSSEQLRTTAADSVVPAQERHLDEEASATEQEDDDEDDNWDLVEAADGEDRNGAKGTSLFARSVVDRYRLAVFRKASTPSRNAMPRDSNMGAQTNGGDSPSPSQPRRPAFRTDPRQFLRPKSPSDGPWSVSVAEYDGDFSLYIKSPTHNFTLTRTAAELVDFDRKLKEAYPDAPVLPLDLANLEKRRPKSSTFLNTLTRLASPKPRSTRSPSTPDASDPFLAYGDIASYLTTISNTPSMHQARVWKRFIRVRTDDLESVRVERAIKRVRSTEAAIRDAVPRPHIPRVLRHRRRVGETEKGEDEDVDVFDGRHSVPIADEDEESDGSGDEGKGYVE